MRNERQILGEAHMETIEHSGFLDEVTNSSRAEAVSQLGFQIKQFDEEEMVVLEGEEIEEIMILHSGVIRGEKFHLEGKVDLMHLYGPGEIFGAEATVSRLKTSPLTYIANQEAIVLSVPFRNVRQSQFADEIMLALLRILADDNIKKLYKIEMLSKRGLRERILAYLRIVSRKAKGEYFSIHMDRAQFAQYLCVNRSALSYELNRMKRDGLIDFGKDWFRILEQDEQNVGKATT